jgi:trehalose 6-phosphate synthase
LRPDDLIWVHDYHLIPFGQMLRRHGVGNPIGFFLHTPFPVPQVLEALPRHEALLEALADFDLVGFQTVIDMRAFLACIADIAKGEVEPDGRFAAFGRTSRAGVFPVGIDAKGFAKMATNAARSPETLRLHESLVGRRLMIGVDRLDYSKGLTYRMRAFEEVLTRWPELRSRVTLLQIAPVSRGEVAQYRTLRRELDRLAGRINGKFSEFDWTPVRYLNKAVPRDVLAGFFRSARVAMVTSTRDGMNLVAKEYVAAQDRYDPGVLVLSRFAGASFELSDALIVNPFDVDEVAAALHAALTMPLDERIARWTAMMAVLRRNTITVWREQFLDALELCEVVP